MVHNVFTYRTKTVSLFAGLMILFAGCTEPFEIETPDFEDILIVNASITNESGTQEIYISRSYASGEDENLVVGATVEILVNGTDRIPFELVSPGVYRAEEDFNPQANTDYQLRVVDENGEVYLSTVVQLTQETNIDQVEARFTVSDEGEEGVEITVDGSSSSSDAPFFRFEYEETYRILSFFNPQDELVIVSEDPPVLEIQRKTREERICYVSRESNRILIAETGNLQENIIEDFPIRFMDRRERSVAERYSILVRQYALSPSAYRFYQTLERFSSTDNLFSTPQPGLIVGNVLHESDPDIKVVGLFEVVSASSKRIFFDHRDVFPQGPKYVSPCDFGPVFPLESRELFERIKSGDFKLIEEIPPMGPGGVTNIRIAESKCVDCNLTGTNVVPEFWED